MHPESHLYAGDSIGGHRMKQHRSGRQGRKHTGRLPNHASRGCCGIFGGYGVWGDCGLRCAALCYWWATLLEVFFEREGLRKVPPRRARPMTSPMSRPYRRSPAFMAGAAGLLQLAVHVLDERLDLHEELVPGRPNEGGGSVWVSRRHPLSTSRTKRCTGRLTQG